MWLVLVACSSADSEYRAMAHTASEIMWVRSLLHEIWVMVHIPMKMYRNNQSAISITSNSMFHERTMHIEVDCYFIRDLVIKKHVALFMFDLRIG